MQKSSAAKLTIVIVNYNTRELVQDCLTSIKNSLEVDFSVKVVVVDNASTDGSLEALKKYSWIKFIPSGENLGFARGNNFAIPEFEGDYVWFLNPDTVLEPGTISHMVRYMDSHPDVGIATPKLVLPDGSFDKNCHRGLPNPWNTFCHFSGLAALFPHSRLFSGYYLGFLPDNLETEVDIVGGSSLLVRAKLGQQIGWWDESYFMYGEDIAMAHEIKKLGAKVMYVPTALVHHYHGASSGIKKSSRHVTKATKSHKLKMIDAGSQAMRTFYSRYYQGKYPRPLTWLIITTITVINYLRRFRVLLFTR